MDRSYANALNDCFDNTSNNFDSKIIRAADKIGKMFVVLEYLGDSEKINNYLYKYGLQLKRVGNNGKISPVKEPNFEKLEKILDSAELAMEISLTENHRLLFGELTELMVKKYVNVKNKEKVIKEESYNRIANKYPDAEVSKGSFLKSVHAKVTEKTSLRRFKKVTEKIQKHNQVENTLIDYIKE
jgi:hypothetical protein